VQTFVHLVQQRRDEHLHSLQKLPRTRCWDWWHLEGLLFIYLFSLGIQVQVKGVSDGGTSPVLERTGEDLGPECSCLMFGR